MRCWISPLLPLLGLGLVLVGCAAVPQRPPPGPDPTDPGPKPCAEFVDAWVEHFRANVTKLDGQATSVSDQQLHKARDALAVAGTREDSCQRPFCVVQPLAGGRLDSYCGYRIADPTGAELYRWVPWKPTRR